MKIKVIGVWNNDAGDCQIVQIKPYNTERELRNDLFWFSGNQRPFYKQGQIVEDTEFITHKCYKQKTFIDFDDIPNDCYMSL
ncbi:hypothetical protein [Eupransor demetentiae]|uniref:YopX protein domain-containing protein n=1 Tax=Eupransor demetentiae TaxID=3109584 RepID=A0ABP0EPJ9_9LACO|nr:hypothetical protein R54876_GBNLAHCA_00709 [Lactobacillaceae bacterium LMG 33000]